MTNTTSDGRSADMPIYIALVGYAGVGKDEVGRILVNDRACSRWAKGDYVKRAVEYVDPWVHVDRWERPSHLPLSTVLSELAYVSDDWLVRHDAAKRAYPDLRRYQQRIADAVIDVCGVDAWAIAMWRDIDASGDRRIVMTRMGDPVEYDMWRARGGHVWRVERPGYGPANDSPNETRLDDADYDAVIVNGGTLDDLRADVLMAFDAI